MKLWKKPRQVLYVAAFALAAIFLGSSSSMAFATTPPTSPLTLPSLTWETNGAFQFLDPSVSSYNLDWAIQQNVYEPLLWFQGTSSQSVIPWLAKSFTTSPDESTWHFTLRTGIHFADGEPLNATAVYFSLNRLLILDGSWPNAHGLGWAWTIQQLLNRSLSSFWGVTQTYNSAYVNNVLGEGFVQTTGIYTFSLHLIVPSAGFPEILANPWAAIIAPRYVMQHDLSIWKTQGYSLPYPKLTGSETNQIKQYFYDEVSTCDVGLTPQGCGQTYLENSFSGSLAGTGPYKILSANSSRTAEAVLGNNTKYWGGPYNTRFAARISTIYIDDVPSLTTRESDLKNAAKSGKAMTIDLPSSNLYDVANKAQWLTNNKLVSTIPGVSIFGPFSGLDSTIGFDTSFSIFGTNVSDPNTGKFYKFQPFADSRLRLAFADAVNLTDINIKVNNKLARVATSAIPPGLPPPGSFNSSITPQYSYNPSSVQSLLLSAMEHPITKFRFTNGTLAPPGTFSNVFGCSKLDPAGKCINPVKRSITLDYATGTLNTVNQAILTSIAAEVNLASTKYNMGLSVHVANLTFPVYLHDGFNDQLYMFGLSWFDDYQWSTDFMTALLGPAQTPFTLGFASFVGWNLGKMNALYNQLVIDDMKGNVGGLIQTTSLMNILANKAVEFLWEYYPEIVGVATSNVHGFYLNPSLYGIYFAALS